MRGGLCNRRSIQLVLALSVLSASAVGASACGDDSSGSGASGQGGTGTGGSGTGSMTTSSTTTTTTGLPTQCDPLELVGGQSIDAGCGIFVDPSAADGGDGTQADPFNSLAVALTEAKMQIPTRSVYVCAAPVPLDEAIVLNDDEYVVGGVDCDTWQAAGTKTEWTDMTGGVPLTISGATAVHVQGFRIIAQNATGYDGATLQGNSSIAVIADGATATLKAVEVIAGTGANGGDGMDQSGQAPGRQSDAAAFDGNTGGGCGVTMGNEAKIYVCPGGAQTIGGSGGDGDLNFGNNGADGSPDYGMATGKGGNGEPLMGGFTCAANFGNGTAGDNGMGGTAGTGGIAASAALSPTGYVGDAGEPGGNGEPGEGGGGGGGRKGNNNNGCALGVVGLSGGGGGAGGCGGSGGGGGGAGGASIALVSLSSTLTLQDTTFAAATGGNGGGGGDPQLGGDGGIGAQGGNGSGTACDGAAGGQGGNGGPGGGGAGGPSLGIAWTGTEPAIDPGNITVAGAAAMGGPGGTGGNAGQPGLTVKVQGY